MVKQLIHVYKVGRFGFADFIRAIYTISTLAKQNGYVYKVALNHPMSRLFDIDTELYETTASSYTELLEQIHKSLDRIIVESNYIDELTFFQPNLIQQYIQPKTYLLERVTKKLEELKLRTRGFVVFHLRFGDTDSEDTNNVFLKRIKRGLSIIRIKQLPVVVISSSGFILKQLSSYPGIHFTGCNPCHTGSVEEYTDSLESTMVEFYLMQHAKKIYSMSGGSFGTGRSGFSYWASKLFNVDFTHLD